MSDWQDISTAPKDGTKFLACSIRNGQHDFLRWVKGRDGYADHFESAIGYGGIPIAFVTHWQPLPAPPKPLDPPTPAKPNTPLQ